MWPSCPNLGDHRPPGGPQPGHDRREWCRRRTAALVAPRAAITVATGSGTRSLCALRRCTLPSAIITAGVLSSPDNHQLPDVPPQVTGVAPGAVSRAHGSPSTDQSSRRFPRCEADVDMRVDAVAVRDAERQRCPLVVVHSGAMAWTRTTLSPTSPTATRWWWCAWNRRKPIRQRRCSSRPGRPGCW
jgi:hypothetical protein